MEATTARQVTKVFPAYARGPFGALDEVAVLLADDRALVVTAPRGGMPRVVAAITVTDLDHSVAGRASFTLTADDGTEWAVRVQGGCGCGNPLKNMSGPAILSASGG